jgi:YHS domain
MKMLALAFLLACNKPAPPPASTATSVVPQAEEPPFPIGTKMKCAVTGEDFTVGAKTVQVVYQGKRYAFCCADCLPEFNKNPTKFARN